MNENLIIAADNAADSGTYHWHPGWWTTELPLENLKNRDIGKAARTTGVDPWGTNFMVDLGSIRTVGLVSLIRHNMSTVAKWRILFSADGITTDFDTNELAVWPVVEAFGVLPWGVFQWGGVVSPESADKFPTNCYCVLDTPVRCRYIYVYMIDSANVDGYIDVGRFYAGNYWQLSVNAEFPWAIGYMDDSTVQYSRGGATYGNEGARRRLLRFQVNHLNEAEIMGQAFEALDRAKGILGDLIVIPKPSNTTQIHRQAVYGRQRVLNLNEESFVDTWDRTFEIEELI